MRVIKQSSLTFWATLYTGATAFFHHLT